MRLNVLALCICGARATKLGKSLGYNPTKKILFGVYVISEFRVPKCQYAVLNVSFYTYN